MQVAYIDGERDGLMTKYYEDGSLKEEWKYSKGIRIYIKKSYPNGMLKSCLLYTSDAADERSSVDLGGRRLIKKKKIRTSRTHHVITTRPISLLEQRDTVPSTTTL